MKYIVGACLLLLIYSMGSAAYANDKRALVIGNGSYQHLGTLKNPVNDAKVVSQTLRLRSLGFQVTELHNRNRKQMAKAISRFGNGTKPGSVALIYFSGHGAQYQGENYLLPVDFETQDEKDLPIEAVSTAFIMDYLKRNTNGLNILILDACRNNPLSSSSKSGTRGLARADNTPPNTYSIYATSPGKVASDNPYGSNGLFTQHLVRYMKQPGLDLGGMVMETRRDVMKASGNQQVPYDYGTLTRRFCMAGCGEVADPVTPVPPVVSAPRRPQPVATNTHEHQHGNRTHAHPLPATGVNHQHGNTALKPTPAVKPQSSSASPSRFQVNGDGTVSDRKTGLMWKRCSEGLSGANCHNGSAKQYTW